jgi:hypothetical protein
MRHTWAGKEIYAHTRTHTYSHIYMRGWVGGGGGGFLTSPCDMTSKIWENFDKA